MPHPWLNIGLEQYVVLAPPEPRARVQKLITYGSGLLKLTQLEEMTRPPRRHPGVIHYLWLIIALVGFAIPYIVKQTITSWSPVFTRLATSFSLEAVWSGRIVSPEFTGGMQPLAYLILVGWLVCACAIFLALGRAGERAYNEARAAVRDVVARLCEHVHWTDLYATNDPMPNGPLPVEPSPRFMSRLVTNAGSFFRDHVAYWRNTDEFVGAVVWELNEVTSIVRPAPWRPAVPHGHAARGRRAGGWGDAAAARGEKRGFIFPIRLIT